MTRHETTTDDAADDATDSAPSLGLGAGILQKALEPIVRAVRREIDSARDEISDRVAGARVGLVLTAVGVVTALVSVGLLATLTVASLALALPLWAAVGIVFAIFVVATAVLLAVGIRGIRRGVPPIPKDTLARR